MTNMNLNKRCTAFLGNKRIATGDVLDLAMEVKAILASNPSLQVLYFDDSSGEQFDLDLRGDYEEIVERLKSQFLGDIVREQSDLQESKPNKGRGRPKLNVVSREITLQPRHWQWLKEQPGSASSVLRRLVDDARRANQEKDKHKHCQEAVFAFISAMAGDLPGYEESLRCLFKSDYRQFDQIISQWPNDIYSYAKSFYKDLLDTTNNSDQLSS